jgi:hypothetical protein
MSELQCGNMQNFVFQQVPNKEKITKQVHKNLISFWTDILTLP